MHPHPAHPVDQVPDPRLATFADAMRSVLRTRHDSLVHGPEALEAWNRADGYVWRWTTDAGRWTVTAGALGNPRPLLHGPGGIWRVDTPAEEAVGLVLLMLRAAGAIPDTARAAQVEAQPVYAVDPAAPARGEVRQMYAMVRGAVVPVPSPEEPPRAVVLRASDPEPELPAGHMAVRATTDEPGPDGRWDVVLPDGRGVSYDPERRCLVPYETPHGDPHPLTGTRATRLLLFEPGQLANQPRPAPPPRGMFEPLPPATVPEFLADAPARGAA